MTPRPNHVDYDPARGTHVSHFTEAMNTPTPSITAEERQAVCDQIERYGLWNTDIAEMLGLVER